jgi:uncharacterized protein
MSVAADNQEPSMEDILASIRKIISEEKDPSEAEPEPMAAAPAPPKLEKPAPAPAAYEDDDDEIVFGDEPEPQAALPPVPAPPPSVASDVLDLTDPLDFDVKPAPTEPALLSQVSESVAAQSFSHLSGLMMRGYPGSENTLEGLVREMLRPMLKEWLDAHLPDMVEQMVAREIARISGRAK